MPQTNLIIILEKFRCLSRFTLKTLNLSSIFIFFANLMCSDFIFLSSPAHHLKREIQCTFYVPQLRDNCYNFPLLRDFSISVLYLVVIVHISTKFCYQHPFKLCVSCSCLEKWTNSQVSLFDSPSPSLGTCWMT